VTPLGKENSDEAMDASKQRAIVEGHGGGGLEANDIIGDRRQLTGGFGWVSKPKDAAADEASGALRVSAQLALWPSPRLRASSAVAAEVVVQNIEVACCWWC
jgi:hypothetical protein